MSQSRNPTDTQTLLQSMLQRLKLQPEREGQAYLHTSLPITAASTCGKDGQRGPSNLQKVNNSPVNGNEFGTNGIPSKEIGISAVESNFGLNNEEIQQPGLGCEVDGGLISFHTQKGNIDGDKGDNRALGQATQPGITPTGTGQLFPAKSLKDADKTSFERTDGERVNSGSSAMTRHTPRNEYAVKSMGQNQDQDQGFTPNVFMWPSKPTDANLDMGSQDDKVFHMGNGGHGVLAQSKDMQFDQKATNSSHRRKQKTSENKTRRWTQRIKERWRDRSGVFGKKGKKEEPEDQKSEQGIEISPQNQLLTTETLTNTSNKEEGRTLPSLDSSDPSNTKKGYMSRSTSDYEFGLGSFSLLEEIAMSTEWANFLHPKQTAASANQRPSEEFKIPPNPHDSSQSSLILNDQGVVNNQWSFKRTEASQVTDFSVAQISPDALLPASMDRSEGIQQQYGHREADRSEPMEHAHTQLDMQSEDSGLGQQLRPPSFVQPADILNNSVLKSRAYLNRKRQHHSEGSISSLSLTGSHVMEETQHDSVMPLHNLNSPLQPLYPYSFTPFAPAPKGVLKHSQDSESSVEIVTKRRRVEENRRVHFSEAVVTIVPPELDPDSTDSGEDSGAEEDSVIEQDCEVEQAALEEVAPARRLALPAWILALKRRNTGRKHR